VNLFTFNLSKAELEALFQSTALHSKLYNISFLTFFCVFFIQK